MFREEVFASYMNLQLQETEVLLLAIKSWGGSGLVKSRQVDSEMDEYEWHRYTNTRRFHYHMLLCSEAHKQVPTA